MTGEVATSNQRMNLTEKGMQGTVVAPQAHVLNIVSPPARWTEPADIASLLFEIGV